MPSDIGDDIAEVFNELGSKVEIRKAFTGETSEEYIDINYEVNHVYPWTSHYMMKCDLNYQTAAEPGDYITFKDDPDNETTHLLVALAKERFEQAVISKEGVLYMCNAFVEVQRAVESDNDDYDTEVAWNTIHSGEFAFVTGILDDQYVKQKAFGQISIDSNQLYMSRAIDLQVDDRCIVNLIGITEMSGEVYVSGESFKVDAIEFNHLPNVAVCKVSEDQRE